MPQKFGASLLEEFCIHTRISTTLPPKMYSCQRAENPLANIIVGFDLWVTFRAACVGGTQEMAAAVPCSGGNLQMLPILPLPGLRAASFAFGLATTLALLGVGSTYVGKAYGQIGSGLPIAISLVAILMGLNLLEVVRLRLPSVDVDVRGFSAPPLLQVRLIFGSLMAD
jgi:hypothetical protein